MILVDLIDFGLPETEAGRDAIGELTNRKPSARAAFGEAGFAGEDGPTVHLRDTARWSGVQLDLPANFEGVGLRFEAVVKVYRNGVSGDRAPGSLRFYVQQADRAWHVGTAPVIDDDRWHSHTVDLPDGLPTGDPAYFVIDFLDGWTANDEHFGCSLGSVAVYADRRPAAAPRPAKGAADDAEVLLVNCPVWDTNMPHIAMGHLASTLRDDGVSVGVCDFNVDAYNEAPENRKFIWHGSTAPMWHEASFIDMTLKFFEPQIQRVAEQIVRQAPRVVAFTISSVSKHVSCRLAEVLRDRLPDSTFVFGGSGIPAFSRAELGDSWDYLVIGAGETPLLHIAKQKPGRVQGLFTRDDDLDPRNATERSRILDVNRMPIMDFTGFDLARYASPWRLPVITSRGCINQCKYCFDHVFYGPFSALTGERAYRQLTHLHAMHGRRSFAFSDLLCNGDVEQLVDMCERLVAGGHEFIWGSFAVLRPEMTPDVLRLLKRAGCKYLHYGFESGSQMMLDAMGRNYTVDQAARVLHATRDAGIVTLINLIVGYPGETDETIGETVDFIHRHADAIDIVETVNPIYLMPLSTLLAEKDDFGIAIPDGPVDQWTTETIDHERREAWVNRVIEGVRSANVVSHLGMARSFQCRTYED